MEGVCLTVFYLCELNSIPMNVLDIRVVTVCVLVWKLCLRVFVCLSM